MNSSVSSNVRKKRGRSSYTNHDVKSSSSSFEADPLTSPSSFLISPIVNFLSLSLLLRARRNRRMEAENGADGQQQEPRPNPQGPQGPEQDPPQNELPIALPDGFVATKTVSSYNKNELALLARHFGLDDTGTLVVLKARVKDFLHTNANHFVPIPEFRLLFTKRAQNPYLPQDRSPTPPQRTPSVRPPQDVHNAGIPRRGFADIPQREGSLPGHQDSVPHRHQHQRRSASPRRERDRRRSRLRSRSPSPRRLPPFLDQAITSSRKFLAVSVVLSLFHPFYLSARALLFMAYALLPLALRPTSPGSTPYFPWLYALLSWHQALRTYGALPYIPTALCPTYIWRSMPYIRLAEAYASSA